MSRIDRHDATASENESALETESPLTLCHSNLLDQSQTPPCGIPEGSDSQAGVEQILVVV